MWLALTQIKSSDIGRRVQAIESLSKVHELKAILALIGALSDAAPRVRAAAANAIGMLRDERCVQPLLATLRDPHARVRESAVEALKSIGHASAVPYLAPLLCDPAPSVRAYAAHALRSLGWTPGTEDEHVLFFVATGQFSKAAAIGGAAVEPLIASLGDESSTKRRAVTDALAEIGNDRAVEGVAHMVDDPDPGVRITALTA